MWALLNKYKWIVAGVLFLIYSVGVWNVSASVNENHWVKRELERTELINKQLADNDKLRDEITALLSEQNAKQRKELKDAQEQLLKDILADPRYKSCRTTDGVRDAIKRKLEAQS